MNRLASNLTKLESWSEIIGHFIGRYRINHMVYFKIGNKTIVFDIHTNEAEILRNKLKDEYIGKTVGVLRTDSPKLPLTVRIIDTKK